MPIEASASKNQAAEQVAATNSRILSTFCQNNHPPETFWRVLGIVGGQDLVCRLPIVQGTSAHSFDPPPSPQHLSPTFFKFYLNLL